MKLALVLAILINYFNISFGVSLPIVYLPNLGKIEGSFQISLHGRVFYSFPGIPYAQPPVDQYRFQEPKPVQPWQGTWKANTLHTCLQYNQNTPPGHPYEVEGDEDCLYLNIYTPNLDQRAKLDVIVFIHGGFFLFDSAGAHGPKFLLDKDVVYISINYRLGAMGFLSTEDDVVPGNNGLKDQIVALEWIKNHVQYFGGNPESVTIMGNSAGGASVHFHYLCPKSIGLFHKGFSQSGTMLNSWVLVEKPLENAKKLASDVGCTTINSVLMVECLKTRPGRQIVESIANFQPWLYNPFSIFAPVLDTWSSDPVLPVHPYLLLKKRQVYDVPWIVSYTNSEGLYPGADFYIAEQYLRDIDMYWNELIPLILDYNSTVDPKLQDEVSQKIRAYYFGDKTVSRSTFLDLIQMISDRLFIVDIQKSARLQAWATTSPVYSYELKYRGAHSWSEYRTATNIDFGASHSDDLCYVYNITQVDTTTTEADRGMIKVLVDLVTSFAKTGVPRVPITMSQVTGYPIGVIVYPHLPVKWPQVPKNLDKPFVYFGIDSADEFSMHTGISENMKFWNSLPIQENEKLFLHES